MKLCRITWNLSLWQRQAAKGLGDHTAKGSQKLIWHRMVEMDRMERCTRRELKYLFSTNVFQEIWIQRVKIFLCSQEKHTGNYRKVIDHYRWLHLHPSFYLQENKAETWQNSHQGICDRTRPENQAVNFQINASFTALLSQAQKCCSVDYVLKQVDLKDPVALGPGRAALLTLHTFSEWHIRD